MELSAHLSKIAGQQGKTIAQVIKQLEEKPFTMKKRDGGLHPVRKVRLIKPINKMKKFYDKKGVPFRYAEYGNNYHIVIYE